MQEYFKIGEISKLYGIGVDTLRYYEKIGILKPRRSPSGYRHYSINDIWKLNTIRDLRGLGFSMEQIRSYLQSHSVDTTLQMLRQERETIRQKIRRLEKLEKNVCQRMEIIESARSRPMDTFTLETYPDRRCYCIPEGYSDEYEMDVLIKRLMNLDQQHLYVIGSNQIGTAISLREAQTTGKVRYQAVFVIDEKGEELLPGGTYLSVSYRGDYSKSREWVEKLLDYAGSHGLVLKSDLLEILWIDIHTSENVREHVTELQVRVERESEDRADGNR